MFSNICLVRNDKRLRKEAFKYLIQKEDTFSMSSLWFKGYLFETELKIDRNLKTFHFR